MIVNEELKHLIVFLLKRGFSLVCVLATLIMMTYQFYKYVQNWDDTQVEYQNFNSREGDVYPSLAICLTALDEERLKEFGDNITARHYAEFLLGRRWDEKMLKVDYENVIKHLDEYILESVSYTHLRAH